MESIQITNYNNTNISDIELIGSESKLVNEVQLKHYLKELIRQVGNPNAKPTLKEIDKVMVQLRHKYKVMPSKADLRYIYEKHFMDTHINHVFGRFMIKKACRSLSGVLVSTIVLRPDVFSCPKKCSYCPTETDLQGNPTQPKSYLSSEPAMLRALKYNFEVRGQMWDRIKAYIHTGNIQTNSGSCKMEIILSGGTW